MRLTHLTLANVRNYGELDLAPAPGLNVFSGANAQGKSNLLEAIGLLGTGKSFRTTRESEVVAHGTSGAVITGEAAVLAGNVRLSCTIAIGPTGTQKRYAVNGRPVRYLSYLGKIRVVTFVPAHLQLVTGPPALRRALLNAALAQESPHYYAAFAAYNRQLAQKGALLRGLVAADETLLATYNERLIESGTRLIVARGAFVAALNEHASATYARWAGIGDGALELRYAANVHASGLDEETVKRAFAARLRAHREAELARGVALVGPHRDDLEFILNGRALAAYGSQGQQRTAILALKLAEYGALEARGGEAPLLLLDDVLSELDAERQHALIDGVASVEQAFITTTSPVALPLATSYRVIAGRVEAVAPDAAESYSR